MTLWGGNVEPDFGDGGGAWSLSSNYEGNGCNYSGDAEGNLTAFGYVNSALLFRTFAYTEYSGSGSQRSANLADYALLSDIPDLSAYVLKSSLAAVATSGDYNDLTGKPTLGALASQDTVTHSQVSDWSSATSGFLTASSLTPYAKTADLATVATSGSYADLSNKPTIPTVPANVSAFTNDAGYLTQHQSLAAYAKTADLAAVATSGSYSDLSNKPTLGSLAAKSSVTTAEISDWSTSTSSFASKTYADDAADAAADAAVPFVVGTQTASTAAWTGDCPELSELRSGQSIRYWLPYAGAANDTLTLTLADGTSTGAIPCYYRGSTRLGTQVAAGTPALLTYVENADAAGTTIARGWWLNAAMDTTTNYYDRLRYQVATYAKSAIAANNIIVADATGGYFQLNKGTAFSILHPILYTTGAIASGKTATTGYLAYYMALATTQAGTWTTRRPVFIKGHLNGTTFTTASTTPLTQTVPTAEDGYQYMYIGCTYSTTHIYFEPVHPIYEYRNGVFRIALDVPDANTTEY